MTSLNVVLYKMIGLWFNHVVNGVDHVSGRGMFEISVVKKFAICYCCQMIVK